ncbi:MAG: transketolase, partial [Rhizomicrobium sp.]
MSMAAEAPALIGTSGDSLREAFGKTLSGLADEFSNVVVLDADIAGGTGVHHFRKSHPERLLQFGIAEQNMMAAAGGLAAVGLIPVVTTFAVFCLRAV